MLKKISKFSLPLSQNVSTRIQTHEYSHVFRSGLDQIYSRQNKPTRFRRFKDLGARPIRNEKDANSMSEYRLDTLDILGSRRKACDKAMAELVWYTAKNTLTNWIEIYQELTCNDSKFTINFVMN